MRNCFIRGDKFRSKQRGATLIELMISVFVFAIGILGFSALQTRSLQATFDNSQRGDVVTIVDGLVARIRANNSAAAKVAYTGILNGAYVCPGAAPAACAQTQGGGVVAACSGAQMAAYDVWDELCNNPNGGLSGVKELSINLTCVAGATCPDGTDLNLISTWCSRSIETDDNVDQTAGVSCDNAIAIQTYQLILRP